jgi:phospholipase D1/2
MNDRSQLGTHDSEIAIIIEDPTPVESRMAGQPWQATRFAASLRRQLFRKHLGLIRPQDVRRPDENFEPVGVPNRYDWDSPEDRIVADPLSDTFESLWNSRARTNTEIFRKVFRAVPDDTVRNWNDYKEFYEYYFHPGGAAGNDKKGEQQPARYSWGHVVRDDFSPGAAGVREVKDLLSRVKGTLVEMPLMFLIEEDIAKEGATLNALTEVVYT